MISEIKILNDWGDVLAVEKPAGWLSIPGRGNKENVPVVSQILGAQLRALKNLETAPRKSPDLFVVHRLDEGTSGVMLFAKTADAHKKLGELFETQRVGKKYFCVVKRNPQNTLPRTNEEILIDAPLFRLPSKKIKSVVSPQGKPSQTQIRVITSYNDFALVEAKPMTGRSHQIRVHLAHLGAPLLGDSLYGGPKNLEQIEILYPLLHCGEIEFEWSTAEGRNSEIKKASAELPPTFLDWVQRLGLLVNPGRAFTEESESIRK